MISTTTTPPRMWVTEGSQGIDTSLEIHLAHQPTNPPSAPASSHTQVTLRPHYGAEHGVPGTSGHPQRTGVAKAGHAEASSETAFSPQTSQSNTLEHGAASLTHLPQPSAGLTRSMSKG